MTIVIAVRDKKNKRIILGADKQATRGQLILKSTSKLFSLPVNIVNGYGEIIDTKTIHIGFSGSPYLKLLIQYGIIIPSMDENETFIEYLYNGLFPVIQRKITDQQLVEIDNSQLDTESGMIFVFDGEIYNIQYNLGVNLIEDDYFVEGSGYEIAIGSLYTNLRFHSHISYERMVKEAIMTVGETTIYCDAEVEMKIIKY